MEFRIELDHSLADPARFEDALLDLDPMAVFSVNSLSRTLEVSTMLAAGDLVEVLTAAGNPTTHERIRELPAFCCGECST